MLMVELIRKKRDGERLTEQEIRFIVNGIISGEIPDYQAAAFLMAVYFQGMELGETISLTRAMMETGEVIDLSDIPGPKVDKHSTGGVGDKVSLILAPLVASFRVRVPMISGRALGHTGGTLDKLESIPGFRTDLTVEEFRRAIKEVGLAIIGQTDTIVPADRKMYALRDVTATVSSIPLITSSILSKKFAEGTDALLLDVKTGSGAFMSNYDDALNLAKNMVSIAHGMNKKAMALITNMDQPLGSFIGNALEVIENVNTLKGEGPDDLRELVVVEAGYMLFMAGVVTSPEEGKKMAEDNLKNGKAYYKWIEMVKNQGGDYDAVFSEDFIKTRFQDTVYSEKDGYLKSFNTREIGIAATVLGAGRLLKDDTIDHKVGIKVLKKINDPVARGEPIFVIFANDKEKMSRAVSILSRCYEIGGHPTKNPRLILKVINSYD